MNGIWKTCGPNHIHCFSSAVIKMEGGTDHDLRILDMPSEEEEDREKSGSVSGGPEPSKREDLKVLGGDRKPSVEKDKTERVDIVVPAVRQKRFVVLLLTLNCPTGGS